jgi:transposase
MDILGIDIGKLKFDAWLMTASCGRHISLPNTPAGFDQLVAWLDRHRDGDSTPLHACMEATGNYGLDLASFLFARGEVVSIVNPRRIKAFGEAELSRNKTDKQDAGLIARFCRAQCPPPWAPPAAHLRELRELTRRCGALKSMRTQEMNRLKSGFASTVLRGSIERTIAHLEEEIAMMSTAIRGLITADEGLRKNYGLLTSIPGIGDVTAALLLAELPNIAEFEPKGLAAFAGLSPAEHSSGQRQGSTGISRIGNPVVRSAMYLCALSARRHNPMLAGFAQRLKQNGKPNRVILVAVARKLLVLAHAVIRTQTEFAAANSI